MEFVLSFCLLGVSGNQIQIVRLHGNYLYTLSHLAGPTLTVCLNYNVLDKKAL